ncbi:VOC family protein [Streptomyces sp. NPDC001700]
MVPRPHRRNRMAYLSPVRHISFDAHDPYALARFWSQLTGCAITDEEVRRLLGLGARTVDDRRTDDGMGWVVMADPEGNEFCVERGAVERGLV